MSPRFIAFGEALTDLVTTGGDGFRALPGGAPWNVARAIAALGVPSAWAGAISRDSFGDALWDASQLAGLDTRFIQRVDAPPLLAVVDRLDPPHYFFIGEGSADLAFDPAALPKDWQLGLAWAHFGGISLVREPLGERLEALAHALKALGVRISFDPNHRALMGPQDLPRMRRFCAMADVVKLSDEDLHGYFPNHDPEDALAALRVGNTQATWLYTQGANGATLYAPGHPPLHQSAHAVSVVDTVGAGDASLAGLLLGIDELFPTDPGGQLHLALAAAAAACSRAGAAAPSRAELLHTLR
jgi:fructokinase